MKEKFKIANIEIGNDNPVFFVAEIGGNHNGDVDLVKKMIDAACYAGAQAVKFQTYITENIISCRSPYFDEFKREQLSFKDLKALSEYSSNKGIYFFSTPFDFESVDFLTSINVPAFKIASCDINNFPLIKKIAEKKRPIILSSGSSTAEDIENTVSYLKGMGVSEVALMQCTSVYPAKDDEINLKVIPAFKEKFEIPVGFSDHSIGIEIAFAAVSLGACIIERHFTIDRNLPGGDNSISTLPEELKLLIEGSKKIKDALGDKEKILSPAEVKIQKRIRKSPVAKRDIVKGEILTEESIAIKRPWTGLPPNYYFAFLGMKARCNIEMDEPITLEKVEKFV